MGRNSFHINLATTTMGGDFTSSEEDINDSVIGSVDIIWVGADTSTGAVVVQASNDKINWCDLPGAATTLSSGSGHKMFEISQFGYHYLRAKFTAGTNTSGLIQIDLNKKSNRF